jgi:hypothetical protein
MAVNHLPPWARIAPPCSLADSLRKKDGRPSLTRLWRLRQDNAVTELAEEKRGQRILASLRSATLGNFGVCEAAGEGIFEMRVHVGAAFGSILCEWEQASGFESQQMHNTSEITLETR